MFCCDLTTDLSPFLFDTKTFFLDNADRRWFEKCEEDVRVFFYLNDFQ